MKRFAAILAIALAPLSAEAETLLAASPAGDVIVRASSGELALIDARSLRPSWTGAGVPRPRLLSVSNDGRWAAAVDPIANRLALASVDGRTSRLLALPESPIAAAFGDAALFILSRDAKRLSRIDPAGGPVRSVETPASPSHLLVDGERVLVYAAVSGEAAAFDPATLRPAASATLPRFGSDLEADGGTAYLAQPRSGRLTAFSLATLEIVDERAAGAVPTDLAIEARSNPARAARIVIADPSSKRLWRDEGAQSPGAAFGRGFLRGLVGLGLFRPDSAEFPFGIDRVAVAGGRTFAFDSSTGTLFAVRGERASEIASGLAWGSFTVARDALLIARGEAIEGIPLR